MNTLDMTKLQQAVLQIATPYSVGTAFYLQEYNLVITNEHLVRDNREVVIDGEWCSQQLVEVVLIDEMADIAILSAPRHTNAEPLGLILQDSAEVDQKVSSIGHPFGAKPQFKEGKIVAISENEYDIPYIEHSAGLLPSCSGGPLLDRNGKVLGMNTFWSHDDSFAIPAEQLKQGLEAYVKSDARYVVRCPECNEYIPDMDVGQSHCTSCGSRITYLSQIQAYEPLGINLQIESILDELGYDAVLARRGPYNWEVQRGSALIDITYHEKTGMINGDAHLCNIPKENVLDLYEFVLKANYSLDGLSFTVRNNTVILSLLIFDQYLNQLTASKLFQHLFEKADYYDDILVDTYGASWQYE